MKLNNPYLVSQGDAKAPSSGAALGRAAAIEARSPSRGRSTPAQTGPKRRGGVAKLVEMPEDDTRQAISPWES